MFHTPDNYHNISMKLSEVLEDIGVNENIVLRKRRTALLLETIPTITRRALGENVTVYLFGSRSEGATTIGLYSDADMVNCLDNFFGIHDWHEWTPGKYNHLMIQNETIPPGYCLLQMLRIDAPLPDTLENGNYFVKDTSGRILYKNTVLDALVAKGDQRQGPSSASPERLGFTARDRVIAYPCKLLPLSSQAWLNQQETNTWPTAKMRHYVKTSKCFVVGVGSKASENAAFEWRFSTSLAERCLMFNLNITQLRCYVLMKMILKTYINIDNESYISSYMCKTVLFHCIACKHSNIWKECNLLNCLSFCIFMLNRCVLAGNCPHFIVHENNLMAGKYSTEIKHKLLERMSSLIPCDGISISRIQIDKLGERFQLRLNMVNDVQVYHNVFQSDEYTREISICLALNTATFIPTCCYRFIEIKKYQCLEMKDLVRIVHHLTRYYREGDMLEKAACRLATPVFCTSIGSMIASHNIQINDTLSSQALAWLEAGVDSDVASGRLKLASAMYCAGDMERTAFFLRNLEEQYKINITEPVCGCYDFPMTNIKRDFGQLCCQYDAAEAVKYIMAFCVRFSRSEINCVPHELRYEMFRSTQEELLHRDIVDNSWMDSAVVDSLPYLYFLQYKTYGILQRPEAQQLALTKLKQAIKTERNFAHRETALNLLGQCMEQENRPVGALLYYSLSLYVRKRNNAAKIHICRCLANIFS